MQDPRLSISAATLPYIDAAWNVAEKTLAEHGELRMMAVFANRADGPLIFLPSAGIPSKEAFAMAMQVVAKLQSGAVPNNPLAALIAAELMGDDPIIHPDLVIHMSEAWMLKVDRAQDEETIKRMVKQATEQGVSTMDERIEVVLVGYKTNDGEMGLTCRQINRDTDGKPSVGDYVFSDHMGNMVSRFFEGIFEEQVVPDSAKN